MGSVRVLTAERMLEIEAKSIVDGTLEANGDLVLTTFGGTEIEAGNLSVTRQMIGNLMYPVGSIYMSTSAANPTASFGGTWVAWGTGRVPVGVDASDTDFNTVEKIGGAKKHTLTAAESGLPAHNHTQNAHTHTSPAHTHANPAHAHLFGPNSQYHAFRWGSSPETNITAQGTTAVAGAPTNNALGAAQGSSNQTAAGTVTSAVTASVNDSTTAINNASTATNASSAHNIQQQFITCFMWKRTV